MTAITYVKEKGFEHKKQNGQIVLRECPYCHDQNFHFYMKDSESGAFFCHKCNQKGNLITLQKHLGDKVQRLSENGNGYNTSTKQKGSNIIVPFQQERMGNRQLDYKIVLKAHSALLHDEEALQYVTKTRGISLETVKAFKLGVETDKQGCKWLMIPHYEKGKLVNVKYRSLPPAEKTFRRIKDCKSVLFNNDILESAEEVFITEGELDALTLIDRGITNVVSGTTGAGSFDPQWIDQLKSVKRIYLAYDGDEAGRKGARELARRLGYDRCFNIELPDGQDVNEYLKEHDVFDFQCLVQLARQFDVAGVLNFVDGLEYFEQENQKPEQTGLQTGFPSVDLLLRTGFNPGELIILSAQPKIGKTTFALQIVINNALRNVPSLFYCLEMRPMTIIKKIIQCFTKHEEIGQEGIIAARKAFANKLLYLGYCYQKPTLEGVIQTIKDAIKRYGLKLVVFDHLHFLCRSITNQVQEVGLAVQAFKFLAEEMEVPIILIAQPRKTQSDTVMTAMDLKDSSAIYSDCDHLIILHRKRKASSDISTNMKLAEGSFEPVTLVRIEASRYNPGGEALLYFCGSISCFEELKDITH